MFDYIAVLSMIRQLLVTAKAKKAMQRVQSYMPCLK